MCPMQVAFAIFISLAISTRSVKSGAIQISRNECQYAGQVYTHGAVVETDLPCLKCICSRGFLICYLRVCRDLPDPPPSGCIVLTRKGKCCPQLICKYTGRGQINKQSNRLQNRAVPTDLEFMINNHISEGSGSCTINGTVYSLGSATSNSNTCRACYCAQGGRENCVRIECVPTPAGCVPVPEIGGGTAGESRSRGVPKTCCPRRYVCAEGHGDSVTIRTHRTIGGGCLVRGLHYKEGTVVPDYDIISGGNGSIISNNRNNCIRCLCVRGLVECSPIVCNMTVPAGCVPIHSQDDKQCCPERYDCSASTEMYTSKPTATHPTKVDEIIDTVLRNTDSITLFDFYDNSGHNSFSLLPENIRDMSQNSTKLGGNINGLEKNSQNLDRRLRKPSIIRDNLDSSLIISDVSEKFGRSKNSESVLEKRDARGSNITDNETYDQILNKTQEEVDDYELDYDTMLPPSLPNVRIIKFEAADALKKKENNSHLSEGPEASTSDTATTTPRAYIGKLDAELRSTIPEYSEAKGFSPPVQTEGGFLPHVPALTPSSSYKPVSDLYNKKTSITPFKITTEVNEKAQNINWLLGESTGGEKDYTTEEVSEQNQIDSVVTDDIPDSESGESALDKVLNFIFSPLRDDETTTIRSQLDMSTRLDIHNATKQLDVLLKQNLKNSTGTKNSTTNTFKVTTIKPLKIETVAPKRNTTKPNPQFSTVVYPEVKISNEINDIKKQPTTSNKKESLPVRNKTELEKHENRNKLTDSDTMESNLKYKVTNQFSQTVAAPEPNSNQANVREKAPNLGGILKLGGCNVYGRIYSVGKIITELSHKCLVCKCSDIGVQCVNKQC